MTTPAGPTVAGMPKRSGTGFGGKKAAPFKSGGGRSTAHPKTAKGMPRKSKPKK